MCQHILSCRNIRKKNTIQIDINYFIPLIPGHLFRRSVNTDSRIVMTELKTAQLFYNLCHHSIYLRCIRTIRPDCNHFSSGLFRNLSSSFLRLFKIQIHNRYICSCLCKCRRCTLADSSCCSCDKSSFSIQSHFFHNTHSFFSFS